MRISDWSSDVCSSDLRLLLEERTLAEQLVDRHRDVTAGLAHDQHALALVQHRALALEELLEVDGGQQVAADVGHAEHPRLRTGHGGDLRHRQDFDDLVETRRQPALADAVADAEPQARPVEPLRPAGRLRQARARGRGREREWAYA